MGETVTAYVALGSNLGDRETNLRSALRKLAALPGTRLVRESAFMETAPVDSPVDAGLFLNAAAMLETSLTARELLQALLDIEHDAGRERGVRNAPRQLDLDLLLYGEQVISEPGLEVPHPRMAEREFVLWPLLQIASRVRDPRTGEPYAEAYHRLIANRTGGGG